MGAGYAGRIYYLNPLYRVLCKHFESFLCEYNRLYKSKYGSFRSVIEKTIGKFIECGDPRYGVAIYKCTKCGERLVVPFSCKTRLFCSSCHQKDNILWVEHLIENIFTDVSHRFWTFSIPKLLRPYFLKNRKLQNLLVEAVNKAFCLVLGNGKITKSMRPGIIFMIQTHGDKLNWHPHLHIIATDGVFDYRDEENIKYHPCFSWNTGTAENKICSF